MSDLANGTALRGWGGRLGMGYKLRLAMGGLIFLMVAVVLLAVVLVNRLGQDESTLNQTRVAFASATATAALEAKGIANDERGFLISADQSYLVEVARRTTLAQSAFDHATQTATGDAQRQATRNAQAGFARWLDALQQEFATFRTDRTAAVAASLSTTRELRKAYEAQLATAQQLGSLSVSSGASHVSVAASWSMRILLACLVVVLLAGLVVSTWVIRSVARPLYSLAALLAG